MQIFIQCITKIFGSDFQGGMNIFVDDFLIASKSFEEYYNQLEKCFEKASKNKIPLKLDKSKFLTNETKFLGYIVSPKGIKMDEENIKAIREFKRPKNIIQLQSFLGLINFFRIFNKDHAELTSILT